MTLIEKKIEKFFKRPASLRYSEIVVILGQFGFELVSTQGSHAKFKHVNLANDLIIPVHNNECKNFYKLAAMKRVKEVIKR